VGRAKASALRLRCAGLAWGALLAGCDASYEAGARAEGGAPATARNVLLIVADTLRADRLGCYGYERATTPAIDALAAEGVLFENCHSQACWTLPSMVSLMAGVPVTKQETMLPELPVLAEALRARGLYTAAFVANAAVGELRGFERGFDHYVPCFEERAEAVAARFEAWYRPWLAQAQAAAGGAPGFFAWVHFVDPHQPYDPAPEHTLFEGPRQRFEELRRTWEAAAGRVAERPSGPVGLSTEAAVAEMNAASNRYDGEVRALDAGVARLVRLLDETGERPRTLIVFCADHGEMLYEQANFPYLVRQVETEHGGLPGGVMDLFGAGHRPWYYEELWRTPLICAGPGMPRGERRGGLAANLDIYPTVLAALGAPRAEHLTGESLLGGRVPERAQVFAYGHRTTAVLDRAGHKLVVHWPRSYLLPSGADPPLELFDLSADPTEQRNLAGARPELAGQLLTAIEGWRAAHDRSVIDTETDEQRRNLEELGYIGDDPGADR
jgi:arylsulfatase A-like enzyme